jgi:hypothetical protein
MRRGCFGAWRPFVLAGLVSIGGLAGCKTAEGSRTDPWYAPVPEDHDISYAELDASNLVPHWEVPHSRFPAAERALEDRAFVEIDREAAMTRYGLGFVELPQRGRLFLLRALHSIPGTGSFEVHVVRRNVVVRHFSRAPARAATRRERSAVIAAIAERPEQVFIVFGLATE